MISDAAVSEFPFHRPTQIGPYSLPLVHVAALAVLVIPFLRLLCIHTVFRPIGNSLLPREKNGSSKNRVTLSLLEKWEMACWSLLFYVTATLYGLYCTYNEPWLTKPARMWYDCDRLPCNYDVSNSLLLQYGLQLGFYVQAVPALYIWDLKRKDFYQMLVHHLVTIGLISYSIKVNFTRAGAMILLIHDVCDVFMEAAKLFRYLQMNQASTFMFGIFVVAWIAMRVVILPTWLIDSCMLDTIGFLAIPYGIYPEPHYLFLNGLLVILYCIHVYWTFLILKILWSVLVLKNEVDDVREEEDKKDN